VVLPRHARTREACAVVFHVGEPETALSQTGCRTPLPDTDRREHRHHGEEPGRQSRIPAKEGLIKPIRRCASSGQSAVFCSERMLDQTFPHGSEVKAAQLHSHQLLKLVAKRTPLVPPSMLHNSELHGKVTVEVCIDQEGVVTEVRGVKGPPFAISSAVESVRNWSFVPYQSNGEAKDAVGLMTLKYDFRAASAKTAVSVSRNK
jgi:TonB-like protein